MNQSERRIVLIRVLLKEHPEYQRLRIPADADAQRQLLRGLLNIREPRRIGTDFLQIQDAYLQEEIAAKGITDAADLTPLQPGLYLWQGDITTLKCDAIVNAANSEQRHDRLLLPQPRLYRQRHPHLCRGAAASCLCGDHGQAETPGTYRTGKDHGRI